MKLIFAKNGVSELISYSNKIVGGEAGFYSGIPEDVKKEATILVLNKLHKNTFFDICVVNELSELHNIHLQSEHKNFLRSLHCVHWGDMGNKTKEYVLALIVKYFEGVLISKG